MSAEFPFKTFAVERHLLRSEHDRACLEDENGVQGGHRVSQSQCCVHLGEAALEKVEEIMREPGCGSAPDVFDQGLQYQRVQGRGCCGAGAAAGRSGRSASDSGVFIASPNVMSSSLVCGAGQS